MKKLHIAALILATITPSIGTYLVLFTDHRPAGQTAWVLESIAMLIMGMMFYHLCKMAPLSAEYEVKRMKKGFSLLVIFSVMTTVLQIMSYRQSYIYQGGDVDPIAFLQKKTSYIGGYHELIDKETNRKKIISNERFLDGSFQEYKLLNHVASIALIRDYAISTSFPSGNRRPKITMNLNDAIIHLPFDETKVRKLFSDQGHSDGTYAHIIHVENMVAEILRKKADPIFEKMRYPPAPGKFKVEFYPHEAGLEKLQEKYGIELVPESGDQNLISLQFAISYSDSNENQELFDYYHLNDGRAVPKILRND